jgi:hypothetical protein
MNAKSNRKDLRLSVLRARAADGRVYFEFSRPHDYLHPISADKKKRWRFPTRRSRFWERLRLSFFTRRPKKTMPVQLLKRFYGSAAAAFKSFYVVFINRFEKFKR